MRTIGALGVGSVVALSFALPAATREHPSRSAQCVQVDDLYERLWTRHDDGWRAGDVAISIALGDGRSLWVFGDSRVGTRIVRNAAVVQSGERLRTLDGQTHGTLFRIPGASEATRWLWPSHGIARGSRLWIFLSEHMQTDERSALPFTYERVWLARLSRTTFEIESLAPLPSRSRVMWGVWTLRRGRHVYVYGLEHRASHSDFLHVARTRNPAEPRAWSYWDGRRWTRDERRSARVTGGMWDQASVVRYREQFVLLSARPFDTRTARITVRTAPGPVGPWSSGEARDVPRAAGTTIYGLAAHPDRPRHGGLLVTYSEWVSGPSGGDPLRPCSSA